MSKAGGFVRRNRVHEAVAAAIAAIASGLTVLGPAEPLDNATGSAAMIGVGAFLTVWAAASAPWWALAVAAGVATATAFDPVLVALGVVAFVLALVIGMRQRHQSAERSIVAGVAVNVLARSELEGFLGLSALVALTTCAFLIAFGISRRPSRIRRPAAIGAIVFGVAVAIGLAMTTAAAAAAHPDITGGADLARRGIDAVEAGDYAEGAVLFGQAADNFERASDRLGGPVALPGRLVPGLSQNLTAGADLVEAAAAVTDDVADALEKVDRTDLGFRGGAVDLAAITSIAEPLTTVQEAITDLDTAVDEARSPWLVAPIQDELDDLAADFDDVQDQLDTALDAVELAPQMLGADKPRRYLLMLATPSEARGLGGFVGNYAEVIVDNGQIIVPVFERRTELQRAAEENGASCLGCPEEVLTGYGQFLTVGGDTLDLAGWQNLTMPAHFPHVAETAQVLYPQSGGRPIDGAIIIDPYVVEALMKYTGPIAVPEFGVTVKPKDAAQFIIEDQYVLAGNEGNEERKDAMQALGEEVIRLLLAGSLPEPAELAGDLGPLVDERRMLLWSDVPEEQDLLERTGLLGNLPELGDDGGFSVSINNSSGNKIEIFLTREETTSIEVDESGNRRLVTDVVLTNGAPTKGYPDYVIGNAIGAPKGTNRALVTFYGLPGLEVATLNGEPIEHGVFTEAGWTAYRHSVTMGPGESAVYHLEWPLAPVADPEATDEEATSVEPEPAGWEQPLVKPELPDPSTDDRSDDTATVDESTVDE